MPIELKIPSMGESITEVFIGVWLKAEGEQVEKDEPLVELESDKATLELPAPSAGILVKVLKQKGETAKIGEVIGSIDEEVSAAVAASPAPPKRGVAPKETAKAPPVVAASAPSKPAVSKTAPRVMPAAQRVLAEHSLEAENVPATGPGGRLLKEDVLQHVQQGGDGSASTVAQPPPPSASSDREEETVPMSPMRRTIAARLVEAQQTTALLTTFNEIDMLAVSSLRKHYQEDFQKKYGVKLGFMSFFVKAAIDALGQFPQVNGSIHGTDIVYHNYFDIGIAVSGGKGLVVPVLRNAERMSFAGIETAISDFGRRAQENKVRLDELEGGTFTISNGGVFGSMLSTPIVNPPQSAILGLHAIQDRPVAREGNVVIRPMMYVALTYDHRLIDGREAVTFLKRIKEVMEEPARMLIEV
jgi:2-oxoglutarate dehydrogenase E2 component (dihydrolipoamide succinyltransferase)